MKQEAVSDPLPALPAGREILMTLLTVRCNKNPGASICRDRGRHSSDSTDVVRTSSIKSGVQMHIHVLPFCACIPVAAP